MTLVWVVAGLVLIVLVGIFIFANSPREIDEEAAHEAANESAEELWRATYHPPLTEKEREAENESEMYDQK